jgi:hypothetical protein
LLTRFNVPFRFQTADSGQDHRLLQSKDLDVSRLPVVRHDGCTMARSAPAQVIEATGGSVSPATSVIV